MDFFGSLFIFETKKNKVNVVFYFSGNVGSEDPYIRGTACSKCTPGQQCDNGLCSGIGWCKVSICLYSNKLANVLMFLFLEIYRI